MPQGSCLTISVCAAGFVHALREAGLELVAQLHTTSTVREGWAGFRYNTSCSVADHLVHTRHAAVLLIAALQLPLLGTLLSCQLLCIPLGGITSTAVLLQLIFLSILYEH